MPFRCLCAVFLHPTKTCVILFCFPAFVYVYVAPPSRPHTVEFVATLWLKNNIYYHYYYIKCVPKYTNTHVVRSE